jgi:hypothetical protein
MDNEQPRTFANSSERPEDREYKLTIEEAANIYMQSGHPRTNRAIQKYCSVSKLDCRKVETEIGEKYLVAPYSVTRHIAYINEITRANVREHSRTDATVRPLDNIDSLPKTETTNDDEQRRTATTDGEHSRTFAAQDDRYVQRLEGDVEFLRGEIQIKNTQIKDLTERARETNILIHGLQKMLSPLLGSGNDRSDHGDTFRKGEDDPVDR